MLQNRFLFTDDAEALILLYDRRDITIFNWAMVKHFAGLFGFFLFSVKFVVCQLRPSCYSLFCTLGLIQQISNRFVGSVSLYFPHFTLSQRSMAILTCMEVRYDERE